MSGDIVLGPVRQTDRHVSWASLFLPGISYHVSLTAEMNSKHLPPFFFYSSVSL